MNPARASVSASGDRLERLPGPSEGSRSGSRRLASASGSPALGSPEGSLLGEGQPSDASDAEAMPSIWGRMARKVDGIGQAMWAGLTRQAAAASSVVGLHPAEGLAASAGGLDRLVQGFEGVSELVISGLEALGRGFLGTTGAYVADLFRDVNGMVFGVLRDAASGAVRMVTQPLVGFERAIHAASAGAGRRALTELGQGFLRGAAAPFEVVGSAGLRSLSFLADRASGPSRPLSESERDMVRKFFGDHLNTEVLRLKIGGVLHRFGMPPFVVGHTVHLPSQARGSDGHLTPGALQILRHEVAHVWQHQSQDAGAYMPRAVAAQLRAALGASGSRGAAYGWRGSGVSGGDVSALNPEAQASFIADLWEAAERGQAESRCLHRGAFSPPLDHSDWAFVHRSVRALQEAGAIELALPLVNISPNFHTE